jgi:folate-binding protein YgfZ
MSAPARWSSPVSLIHLDGRDSLRFLHGQSSQAFELAKPGDCLATCLISPTARMRALALVLVEADGADLVVVAGDGAAVHQALDRVLFPADQVRLGALQAATLVRLVGAPAATSGLQPRVNLGGGSDQPVLLLQPHDALPAWAEALPELSPTQAEQQRLRQGFPTAPGELNNDTNPFELGLAPWVSLTKGCYVGQETLAKLATYDGVKQQLRYWRCADTGPAAAEGLSPGTTLTTAAGERAGVITSRLASADGLEGLALVRRQALAEPQLLVAAAGGEPVPLEISVPEGFVPPPVGAGGGS